VEARLYPVLAHPLVRYGVGLLALFLLLVLAFALLPPIVALAGPPPDLWFLGYGPERLAGFLGALGEKGRALYRLFLLYDLGFAPIYGAALSGWLYHFYRAPGYARPPLVAALADLGENLLLLSQLGQVRPGLAVLAGYLTFFKWVLLAFSLGAALYALRLGRR